MEIEVGKTYETRDGRLARVICTDRKQTSDAPVMALVTEKDGEEWCYGYSADGVSAGESRHDLMREHVPVTYRRYRVFDDKSVGVSHTDKPDWDCSCVGIVNLAFDPSGNLVIDKCEITGAQPNG